MDDQAYLEPGFDPASLTMPRLRNILVMHNVQYQSAAKKQQLVDLFNEQVLPQARSLRNASARVKRTSRGIEDAASSHSASYDEEEEADIPVPVTPAARSGRRTTRARTEEAQEVPLTSRSTRHSTAPPEHTPHRSISKHARRSEVIQEEPEARRQSTARKSRANLATPIVKSEPRDDESPFSSVNVFQTGSSPPTVRASESARRRSSMGPARDVDRQSKELRRQTDNFRTPRDHHDSSLVPSRKTYEMPVAVVKKEEIEPSEEFTPEEQLELVQATQSGEIVPARRATRKSTAVPKQAISVVSVLMVVLSALVWRQEKLEVGYCGVGHPSTEIAGVEIPEWAQAIRPQCEPCPPHAFCGEQLFTECENGFVLANHPLSLGGAIPLPPTCEPDSARARKVNAVKERAVEELRQQNARYECGEAPRAEIKETELKQSIATKRRKGMTNEEFEDLWASAIGEIAQAEEVTSGSDGSGHATLRSTSLARVPLGCAIRRSLFQTVRRHLWQLVAVLFVISGGAYGQRRIVSGRETEKKAKQLAGLALEKLSIQASLHAQDPTVFPEGYMSMTQLRDDVLRDDFSAARRKLLWEKVQKKVEANSNVRPMVRESRTGDVGRVWEWVGAVRMIESPAPAGDRRKSGRVSFADDSRYIEPATEPTGAVQKRDVGHVGKWEERRNYY